MTASATIERVSEPLGAATRPALSQRTLAWRQFRRHRLALAGAATFLALCLTAVLAPVSPYDPNRTSLLDRFEPPSLTHPMGTDDLGRDELTRVLIGGRISLAVGMMAMITGFWTIVLVVGLLRWMPVARLVRAAFLQLKEQEFVTAARALGAPTAAIMWRHILPNALSPIIVAATLGVAGAILTESTLSFLGLGIQLPTATWGNMLRAAQNDMTTAPWLAFFPGFFIFLTILSSNYIGDGLRDALDPHKQF